MAEPLDAIEREILAAVRGIRYGSIGIVIHDSRVVQIERTERVRPVAAARPEHPEDRRRARQPFFAAASTGTPETPSRFDDATTPQPDRSRNPGPRSDSSRDGG
jgi:hypothetical protein